MGREWVFGCDGVLADLVLGGAVAPGGADEPFDGPPGGGLDTAGHGQRGEHDGQVGLDGLTLVVVDRPRLEVVLDIRKLFSMCHSWW